MTDVRKMFDSEHMGAWDLDGQDRVVTIRDVRAGELTNGTKKSKKPIVYIQEHEKGFVLNKTNMKVIVAFFGPDTRTWIGRKVIIYPTTTTFGGNEVDCIRVRNKQPLPERPALRAQNTQRGRQGQVLQGDRVLAVPAQAEEREPGDDSDVEERDVAPAP